MKTKLLIAVRFQNNYSFLHSIKPIYGAKRSFDVLRSVKLHKSCLHRGRAKAADSLFIVKLKHLTSKRSCFCVTSGEKIEFIKTTFLNYRHEKLFTSTENPRNTACSSRKFPNMGPRSKLAAVTPTNLTRSFWVILFSCLLEIHSKRSKQSCFFAIALALFTKLFSTAKTKEIKSDMWSLISSLPTYLDHNQKPQYDPKLIQIAIF